MALREFGDALRQLAPDPPSWLFVCDGNPFDSKVFVIGANPARNTGRPFWSTYWNDEFGLDKGSLLSDLGALAGGFTPTRIKLESLRDRIPRPILDANTVLRDTPLQSDLTANDVEATQTIEFLVRVIQPDVVVAQGAKAFDFFNTECGILVEEKLVVQNAEWNGARFQFVYCTHLSRISNDEFDDLVALLGGI